ncbi:MAG: hypothetical protein FWD78_01995 [Treponema sp.]|nr:hypothetical protein [Treponema sp.]
MKRNLLKHGGALFVIILFVALAFGSATQVSSVQKDSSDQIVISSETQSTGIVHDMQDPMFNGNMEYSKMKPYTTLGMVFATSTTNYDENGHEFASQESVLILLLKEAFKLGADDIVNLRTSVNTTWYQVLLDNASQQNTANTSTTPTKIMKKTVMISGSALAIKYIN